MNDYSITSNEYIFLSLFWFFILRGESMLRFFVRHHHCSGAAYFVFFVQCFEERNAIETNPQWQSCMWLCAPVRTTEKRSSIARWSILMAHLIDQYYFICSNEWNMCWRPIHAHGNYVMFAMCCCVVLFVASGYLCKTQNLRQSTAAVSRADDDRATWCRCVDIAVCIHRYSSASVVIASEMGKSDRWLRFARLELILVS